jgi:hypothetical protein
MHPLLVPHICSLCPPPACLRPPPLPRAGAADGCVRVWRAYLNHGLQRLATAWQAVPLRQPPALLRQGAAYALTEYPSLLYAAGGCHPDVLQVRREGWGRGRLSGGRWGGAMR